MITSTSCAAATSGQLSPPRRRTGAQSSTLHATALAQCGRRCQPYLGHVQTPAPYCARAHFNETRSDFAAGIYDGAPDGAALHSVPRLQAVVNPECRRRDDQRQNAIQLHRLTCCSVLTVTEWYHTCLLAIVLCPCACRWSGRRRICQQSAAWCAARDDDADDTPYRRSLRPQCIHANHTLIICSPLRLLCKRSDAQQVAAMHRVHAVAFDLRRMPCLTCCRVLWTALESSAPYRCP
jgi:hypothetical protein